MYRALDYFEKIEKPVAFVFQKMEQRGVRIDIPYLQKLESTLSAKRAEIEKSIKAELGDINLNSPKQLLEALNEKGIKPLFKNKPSTDKRALDRLREMPIVSKLLQYGEIETLLASFIVPYLARKTEIVHPSFLVTTRTARPNCHNPNLLQIPKRTAYGKLVRRMFIAKEGYKYADFDYSQIEPRLLAHISKDKKMIELFHKDIDFHTYFADSLNISRDNAKVFDLETYYRATKYGVSRHLKCSLSKAQEEIDKAWNLFPELHDWEMNWIYETKKRGYCETLFGRRIKIEGLDNTSFFIDKNTGEKVFWIRDAAERQTINNTIQGSAAEVIKFPMIELDKLNVNMLIQVYDELLIEEKEKDIQNVVLTCIDKMTQSVILDVPLKVDYGVGTDWAGVKN